MMHFLSVPKQYVQSSVYPGTSTSGKVSGGLSLPRKQSWTQTAWRLSGHSGWLNPPHAFASLWGPVPPVDLHASRQLLCYIVWFWESEFYPHSCINDLAKEAYDPRSGQKRLKPVNSLLWLPSISLNNHSQIKHAPTWSCWGIQRANLCVVVAFY